MPTPRKLQLRRPGPKAPPNTVLDALRVDALRAEIARHDALYEEGRPEVSDEHYDRLLGELALLEERHPTLKSADSPTAKVRDARVAGFAKRKHLAPMLSLGNLYTDDELDGWLAGCSAGQPSPVEYVVEPKVDGIALSLTYAGADLVAATTRGDGEEGDDVLANALRIDGIPRRLVDADWLPGVDGSREDEVTFEVRGEVYMPRAAFERLNADLVAAGSEPFANPRNAAGGSLRLKDPAEVGRRGLAFVAHGLGGSSRPLAWRTHTEALAAFASMGVAVVGAGELPEEWIWNALPLLVLDDHASVREAVAHFAEGRKAPGPYDTDGIVIKVNSLAHRARLGARGKSPRWAAAYKYETEKARTVVESITVQVGKTGKLTPVANLKPVSLCGTTVARASLHNFDEIARLDARVGDTVVIEKAAEIIPQVVASEGAPDGTPRAEPFPRPTACPSCGGPLRVEEGVVDVFCAARPASTCPDQLKALVRHYASRTAMDIESLGEVLIAQLVDKQIVLQLSDVYALTVDSLRRCNRMGEKLAEKILQGIEESRDRPLRKFLIALPIPMVGEGGARRLAEHFGTFAAIRAASVDELAAVKDVGRATAEAIRGYFDDPEEARQLDALLANVAPKEEKKVVLGAALAGKTIVVTGTLEKYGRKEIEDLIRAHGGTSSGSVSKKTSYLVAGAEAGSKLAKAQQLGVPVLDEAGFEALLAAPVAP